MIKKYSNTNLLIRRINYYRNRTRNFILRRNFLSLSLSASISSKAIIIGRAGISIEAKVQIHPNAILICKLNHNGKIKIGKNSQILPYAYLDSTVGSITIGDYCTINPYSVLYGHGGLSIGNHVRIATHAVIVPGNHKYDRLDIPIWKQGADLLGIEIEDDVWIGANVTILDGVKIRRGCVIGASSVVTRSTESYGVYVGAPATFIQSRKSELSKESKE